MGGKFLFKVSVEQFAVHPCPVWPNLLARLRCHVRQSFVHLASTMQTSLHTFTKPLLDSPKRVGH